MVTRREFLGRSAAGLAAAAALGRSARAMEANPLGMPIGFQTWVVRDRLGSDLAGTLRQMAAIGFQTVEMCSPAGYGGGFAPLAKLKTAELRRIIEDAGLKCESCHFQFQELQKSLPERIAFAQELGLKQMVIASYGLPRTAKLADWKRACDRTNTLAETTRKAGLPLAYHNHNFEVQKLEGQLIYDAMMAELDPALVKMQFQVAVINEGFEAAAFFRKYPGRFLSMHLADWSSATRRGVAVGKGIVDWKALFAAAPVGGIQNYFVELDPELLAESYAYLHEMTS